MTSDQFTADARSRAQHAVRRPPPLASGSRVALIAPAGPLRGSDDVARGEENARQLGWEIVIGEHALAKGGYLAGSDAERLSDLNAALRDPDIHGIWCLRGGYGAMRLLEDVDYGALRRQPKAIIGYSDITALHHAIAVRAGVGGHHGPCSRGALPPFSRDSLARAVAGADSCGTAAEARTLRAGRASGPLTGGNLALVASLVGTPWLYFPDGAIMVLEDVNEPVYRIDRMLRQLRLSGTLARCSGLIFGAFTERGSGDAEENGDAALEAVLLEAAEWVNGPCIAGAPVGHIDEQWSWTFGAIAEFDAGERRVSIMNGGV